MGVEGCDMEGVLAQETHGQCAWTGAWRAATWAREGTWVWVEGGRENEETAEVRLFGVQQAVPTRAGGGAR